MTAEMCVNCMLRPDGLRLRIGKAPGQQLPERPDADHGRGGHDQQSDQQELFGTARDHVRESCEHQDPQRVVIATYDD